VGLGNNTFSACNVSYLRNGARCDHRNLTADYLGFLLSADPNITDLLQRERPEILSGMGAK